MNVLVSALWCRVFPPQDFGPNYELTEIFTRLSHWPEVATLQLCPIYFDQVTFGLPARHQVKHVMWVPLL